MWWAHFVFVADCGTANAHFHLFMALTHVGQMQNGPQNTAQWSSEANEANEERKKPARQPASQPGS